MLQMRDHTGAQIFLDGHLVEMGGTRFPGTARVRRQVVAPNTLFPGRARVGVIGYNGRGDVVYFRAPVVSKASSGKPS